MTKSIEKISHKIVNLFQIKNSQNYIKKGENTVIHSIYLKKEICIKTIKVAYLQIMSKSSK